MQRKHLRIILFVLPAVLLTIAAVLFLTQGEKPVPTYRPEAYGIQSMLLADRLPYLRPDVLAGQSSSYDRSGENNDGFGKSNYLYVEPNGEKVILDVKGPGTVYRMWFTGFDVDTANLKIYIDGQEAPVVDSNLWDLLEGKKAPFLSPLAGSDQVSSGGFYSYLPIPFAKSIKITTNGEGPAFFYQFGYHTYPADRQVQSWTGKEDISLLLDQWNHAGQNPKNSMNAKASTGTTTLAAGETAEIFRLQGGAYSISSIKLQVPGISTGSSSPWEGAALLNDVWIRFFWDKEQTPSVEAPIGAFFAIGHYTPYGTRSLMAGLDDTNTLYMYFPMPFDVEGRVELVNKGTRNLQNIHYEIGSKPFEGSMENVGYFKTHYNSQIRMDRSQSIQVLDVQGAGSFVGLVQSVQPYTQDQLYLEGDERIWVDDCRSPAIQGTGTEDFYNAGWYFNKGLFTLPLHGYTAHHIDEVDKSSMYRWLLQDAIPFRSRILVQLEHGNRNDTPADAWTLAYYYHQPQSRLQLTDTLDIGDAASEKAHNYIIDDQTRESKDSQYFEGFLVSKKLEDSGRFHQGKSSFTVKINPRNKGVLLRRLFNQSVINQQAQVYVNNQPAGTWYTAGGNRRKFWKEEDFLLPASLTQGKKKLEIRIEYVAYPQNENTEWSEYRYEVHTVKR